MKSLFIPEHSSLRRKRNLIEENEALHILKKHFNLLNEIILKKEEEKLIQCITNIINFLENIKEITNQIQDKCVSNMFYEIVYDKIYQKDLSLILYCIILLIDKNIISKNDFLTKEYLDFYTSILMNFSNYNIDIIRNILIIIQYLPFNYNEQNYFLEKLPMKMIYELIQKINEEDLIVGLILCVKNFAINFLISENEDYVLKIISYIANLSNRSLFLESAFIKNSFITIYLLLKNHSFNYQLFIELNLLEFTLFHLHNPPIETQSTVCKIIYYLSSEYNCEFNLQTIKYILSMIFKPRSLVERLSSLMAFLGIIKNQNDIAINFIQNQDEQGNILHMFYSIYNDLDIQGKKEVMRIINVFVSVLDITNYNKFIVEDSKILFSIIENGIETQETEFLFITIQIISNIFALASRNNSLSDCKSLFNDQFDLSYLVNLYENSDEKNNFYAKSFFLKYFN